MSAYGVTPLAMGLPEAAAYLSTERKTLQDAIDREQLIARKIGPKGGRWSVKVTDLVAWYDALGREARDDEAS